MSTHIRKFQRASKAKFFNDTEDDREKIKDPAGITMWNALA